LIFAEITPKTLAAIAPEKFAFPATLILVPLLKIFYPLVWVINMIPNAILRLFGFSAEQQAGHHLSRDELRTVVYESKQHIPEQHHEMLLGVFDLEKVTVDDIMVPRNEIVGIDIADEWDFIETLIINSQHTRLPVYEEDIDNMIGVLHIRKYLAHYFNHNKTFNKEDIRKVLTAPYYIPEGTPLNTQLLHFQQQKHRIGMVIDEYGDIQGLATIDDILEEIVGEFTTDPSDSIKEVHLQEDGSYLIDGSISVRELNRIFKWRLNTKGAKTLNGLILEYMETIPESGTSLMLDGHPLEIVLTTNSGVKTVRVVQSKQ
jgi:Mg2+/Co2+ transporter CorB